MRSPYFKAVGLCCMLCLNSGAIVLASGAAGERRVWQPEEVGGLAFLRAVHSMEPGSIVQLGAGEFAPMALPEGIGVRGGGVEATTIVVPAGKSTGLEMSGSVTASHLSVRSAPESGGGEPSYQRGIFAMEGPITIESVRVGPFEGNAIVLRQGNFTVRNVTIVQSRRAGLVLQESMVSSVVENLSVSGTEYGFDLHIGELSGGVFKNLTLSAEGDGGILIVGAASAPELIDLEDELRMDIMYEDGALPRAVISPDDREALTNAQLDAAYNVPFSVREFSMNLLQHRPRWREATRQYVQAVSAQGVSGTAYFDALRAYLLELLDGYGVQSFNPWVDPILLAELRELHDQQGPEAVAQLIASLPEQLFDPDFYYLQPFDEQEKAAIKAGFQKVGGRESERLARVHFSAFRELLAADSDPLELRPLFEESVRDYLTAVRLSEIAMGDEPHVQLSELIRHVIAREKVAEIAAIISVFPEVQGNLPARRLYLRDIPNELRREVVQAIRILEASQR